jgi:hypothetical protein
MNICTQRNAATVHDARVQAVTTAGEGLIAKQHPQSDDIRTKVDGLAADRKALDEAYAQRQKEARRHSAG